MNITKEQWILIVRSLLVCALAIASILGYDIAIVQPREILIQEQAAAAARAEKLTRGVSHFTEVSADTLRAAAPTAVGTATPALMVDSEGISIIFEVRDSQTPVFTIADGGGVSWPSGGLHVAAPTAVGTATPAFFVDSDGVSNIFEVRDAGTPVFTVADGGTVSWPSSNIRVAGATTIPTATPALVADSLGVSALFEVRDAATPVWQVADGGDITHTGDSTQTGYQDITGGAYIAAPTAIATATPVFMLNSTGVSNLFELRSAATPVFYVDKDGNLTSTGSATLPLVENSIDADQAAFMTDLIYFCGQQANSGTMYFAPVLAFLTGDFSAAYVIGDAQCNALDDPTEATIDEPIGYANTSFKVLGMMCEASSSGSNGVTFTLRSAAADLTPSMTCTIATGDTTCTSVTSSTTDIAAGATVAMKVVNTEDLSAEDGWCKVLVAYK